MDAEFETEEAVMGKPLLLSGRAAAQYLGIDPGTFRALAEANGLEPVTTGRRKMWKRPELERLVGLKETA